MTLQGKHQCACGSREVVVGRAQNIAGETIYPQVCAACGDVKSQYVRASVAAQFERKNGPLPEVQTRTRAKPEVFARAVRARNSRKCEVCGTGGAQVHHWAPRHLFGEEAFNWPTSLLCQTCHTRWHQIVTPSMGQRP